MTLPNSALQRTNTSVALLPRSFAECQGRWADERKK
jgi:hypothetical protein